MILPTFSLMNMTKIKANTRISGEYGRLKTGETGYCKPSTAKELQMRGLATIVDENVEHQPKEVKPFITLEGLNNPQPQSVLYKDPDPENIVFGTPGPEIAEEEKEPAESKSVTEEKNEDQVPAEKKEYESKPEKKEHNHVPKKQYNKK